jgi:signal recognition particle receptor subunit alpha
MIDAIWIFTRGGVVLFHYQFIKVLGNPIDTLIKTVLLEQRIGEDTHVLQSCKMKWRLHNQMDVIAVIVYQGILQVSYLDDILDHSVKAFAEAVGGKVDVDSRKVDMKEAFLDIMKGADKRELERKRGKKPVKDEPKSPEPKATNGAAAGSPAASPGAGDKPDKLASPAKGEAEKKGKKGRNWAGENKVNDKSMAELDFSKGQKEVDTGPKFDGTDLVESDVESLASDVDKDEQPTGIWGKLTSSVKNFTGNKKLTKADIQPVLEMFSKELMSKNVAQDVAVKLTSSVEQTLLTRKTEAFQTVTRAVKEALTEACEQILTPKRSIDVLRAALQAKAAGKVYSVVFLGVNGVGKSTNLAKVAYYLKHKGGLNVMVAACDTFRAGAVEQLRTHGRNLGLEIFDRGYGKDPADIAKHALQYAAANHYDVVLVDTAGRMQDNEPLMRALAKLVAVNNPDLVLFVGEALVGNDGVDQLVKFHRSLIDFSLTPGSQRGVDAILLTKYDTVDDKVGAALTMVYVTGQPVVFVGCGQKYTHLRKLQVKEVVKTLLS